jgi:hypothetical protein
VVVLSRVSGTAYISSVYPHSEHLSSEPVGLGAEQLLRVLLRSFRGAVK